MWKPTGSEVNWAERSHITGTGYWVQVFAWSLIGQSLSEWTFNLLAIRCLRLLRLAEKDNLSLFDFKTICPSQSIKITKANMHALSAGIQSAGDLVPCFKSCIKQRMTTGLLSIWKSLACVRASKLITTNMYVCMYGRVIFCIKNVETFTRTSVRVSKMNVVVCAQLTFINVNFT